MLYMVYRSLLGYFSSTMFTSLPPRRLRWSVANRVPAPHSGMSLLILPKGVGVRVALPGQRQICGSSFSKERENSLWLECPDANGTGLLNAGHSGEERCTPHHMVPVSPQSLPPRNVAELGGSPPFRGL